VSALGFRKILGARGEELAVDFLQQNGYRILAKNFSNRMGEIDLIAERAKELHFIEVKTRSDNNFFEPEEAVDFRKQSKIRKVAQVFLSNSGARFSGHDIYLDVIAVIVSPAGGSPVIKHLIGAF